MQTREVQDFDAEVARKVDNELLPGFGVPQAGMIRNVMFDVLANTYEQDPAKALSAIGHWLGEAIAKKKAGIL